MVRNVRGCAANKDNQFVEVMGVDERVIVIVTPRQPEGKVRIGKSRLRCILIRPRSHVPIVLTIVPFIKETLRVFVRY